MNESLKSTSRHGRWWIFAFVQFVAFLVIGEFMRPHLLLRPALFFLVLCSGLMLAPVSAWLWLDISGKRTKTPTIVSINKFLRICLTATAVLLTSLVAVLLIRALYPFWVFLTVISSFIFATSVLTMLYVVLCGQSFARAWALAIDTWHKKISLIIFITFVIIVCHGVSFAFVHGVWKGLNYSQFSVLSHSATIWILLVVLCAAIAYIAAVLNSFLVYLFLEIIKQKKDPEAEKQVASNRIAHQTNI